MYIYFTIKTLTLKYLGTISEISKKTDFTISTF